MLLDWNQPTLGQRYARRELWNRIYNHPSACTCTDCQYWRVVEDQLTAQAEEAVYGEHREMGHSDFAMLVRQLSILGQLRERYELAREAYFDQAALYMQQGQDSRRDTQAELAVLQMLSVKFNNLQWRLELAGYKGFRFPEEASIINKHTRCVLFRASFFTCQRVMKRLSDRHHILVYVAEE